MADRTVHYEAAFEAMLRERGIPYVAVDEAKKALFHNAQLKSFDFVVYSKNGPNLLVDVKGRQLLTKNGKNASMQTWATERDVADMLQWQQVFGNEFSAILAFVYWIEPPIIPGPGCFQFRDRWYHMLGIRLSEYRNHMRRRSVKWETVSIPAADFKSLAQPIENWL